jgi:carboxyl-terminal processing protease
MFTKKSRLFLPLLGVLLFSFAFGILKAQTPNDDNNIYKQLRLLTDIINQTVKNYVDPINYKKFVMGGIRGALGTLDPHTFILKKKNTMT